MTTTLIIVAVIVGEAIGANVIMHDFPNKERCEQAKQIVMELARGHGSADREISAYCMEHR